MIDMGAEALHQRVASAQAEQRAAFGRSGRGAGVNGSSAADDFYRSFVGGRR